MLATSLAHFIMTCFCWIRTPEPVIWNWLVLDPLGLIFLTIASGLFLATACYAISYLQQEQQSRPQQTIRRSSFFEEPESVLIACLLFFLSTVTAVTVCQNFGLLWVAVEATTVASAPMIYFHHHRYSQEATWKYLMICSVGIAIALLGNFLLAVAVSAGQGSSTLVLADMLEKQVNFNPRWLQAAFIFFLVGYGTKAGLAPLHTWLPDAYSEAPSMVSALLSGALSNCAFLAILRCYQVCSAAGQALFAQHLLLAFGIISLVTAAIFILKQTDYKRLLAYSSVEHMGILALGVGLGGTALYGTMFHVINNSLTKATLFLLAGNMMVYYKTKNVGAVTGALRVLPITGALWMAGILSITGSPPFGTFLSEFIILRAAFAGGHAIIGSLFIGLLAVIFIGMGAVALRMAQGKPNSGVVSASQRPESLFTIIPPAILMALVLILGIYTPQFIQQNLMLASDLIK